MDIYTPLEFTLTEEHVMLLRELNIDEIAVGMDRRRPYGNGDHIEDMARILGIELVKTYDEEMVVLYADGVRLQKLHEEMGKAMQVVLASASFKPGLYQTTGQYVRDWSLVEETT